MADGDSSLANGGSPKDATAALDKEGDADTPVADHHRVSSASGLLDHDSPPSTPASPAPRPSTVLSPRTNGSPISPTDTDVFPPEDNVPRPLAPLPSDDAKRGSLPFALPRGSKQTTTTPTGIVSYATLRSKTAGQTSAPKVSWLVSERPSPLTTGTFGGGRSPRTIARSARPS